ncbi:hypothetical protein NST07_13435 [Paenibacillus sp. FSL L8-0340]|uniref:hypothetical protein n=1 Tax=Paenibacillus sp. FSL L8-0340 TaxID=2954685 RepID=UPI0031583CBE
MRSLCDVIQKLYELINTVYVSADAKSIYMLTKDNKVVLFSDKLFVQYINDALEG